MSDSLEKLPGYTILGAKASKLLCQKTTFLMEPIPEIPLTPSPQTNAARDSIGFKWAGPMVGKRHKLGGSPDWIQGDNTPRCECGQLMQFYGQFDSIGDRFCLADAGMIFVFVCSDCWTTKSILQCG